MDSLPWPELFTSPFFFFSTSCRLPDFTQSIPLLVFSVGTWPLPSLKPTLPPSCRRRFFFRLPGATSGRFSKPTFRFYFRCCALTLPSQSLFSYLFFPCVYLFSTQRCSPMVSAGVESARPMIDLSVFVSLLGLFFWSFCASSSCCPLTTPVLLGRAFRLSLLPS